MPPKPSSRWKRLETLFDAAVLLPAAERAAFVLEQCPDDPDLRRQLSELLAMDDEADASGFLATPISAGVQALATEHEASRLGERVGPYRLIEEIGHGGMGTVYLAERADAEYEARVAIKFVRGVFGAPELARRLRAERQVLAGLQHPGIARLIDGGTADDGTPYLVMEYVDGQPIDAWCTAHGLGLTARLALFREVCAAVQYAHQALVVHRDLKPSNILVRADGTPTLVDFGIAKLLDPAGIDDGDATETLGLMTPTYASPEQITGRPVTVATDVYSLGVVLYRLLTDRPPFDLTGATAAEIERRVTGEEPPRPSQATADRATARELTGDLDTIVLKALRKEPERRYGTVAELVDDLERYRAGRPVLARRETFGYVAGKFVRRHRGALGAATGVLLVIAALTTFYTVRLTGERDRARAAAVRADRVVEFLKGVFLQASPDEQQGAVLTAPQLLARGVAQIDTQLAGQPATRADLKNVVGDVYRGLGMYPAARRELESALAIREQAHLPEDTVLADIYSNLSVVARLAGDFVSADTFAQRGVSIMGRKIGTENAPYANVLNSLAEAKRIRGDLAAAERLDRQVLAIRRRVLPPIHDDISESLNNLALILRAEGKYVEAEKMERESLEMKLELGAPARFEVSNGQNNLALMLTDLGKFPEAGSLFVAALDARRQTFGPNAPRTLNTQQCYGMLLYHEGRFDSAQRVLDDALRRMRANLPPGHPYAGYAMKWLALTLSAKGLDDSARATGARAVAIFEKLGGPTHISTLRALRALGLVDAAAGDRVAAESLLVEAYDGQRTKLGPEHPETKKTARDLVRWYETWGKPALAARYAADTD